MTGTPRKTFHFDAQTDYALTVLLDSWVHLTALLEASASILEEGGFDLADVNAAIGRGDRALVACLRRDRTDERMS